MIDAHVHLDHFANPTTAWAKLRAVGVERALLPGVEAHRPPLQLRGVDCAAGQHPCFPAPTDWLGHLAKQLTDGSIQAVGELGLDRRGQPGHEDWVAPQIQLAKEHRLPLILHVVGERSNLLEQVRQHPHPAMLHRCSGRPSRYEPWWQAGVFLSVGPTVGEDLRLLEAVPDHLLLLESDAETEADKPWESLPQLYAAAARAKRCTLASICTRIAANYTRFLNRE